MDGGRGKESRALVTKVLVRDVAGIITMVIDCYGGCQKRWPVQLYKAGGLGTKGPREGTRAVTMKMT